MKKYSLVVLVGLAVVVAAAFVADSFVQAGSSSEATLLRASDKESADKPSGRVKIRIGTSDGGFGADGDIPPEESSRPPAEPGGSGAEEGESPEFFGEKVGGTFMWVLDSSLSMHRSDGSSVEDTNGNLITNAARIDIVKIETIKVLRELPPSAKFDIVLLAGNESGNGAPTAPPVTDQWQGKLVQADAATVDAAISYVSTIMLWFGTPSYTALKRACSCNEHFDKLFFLTDGSPTRFDIPSLPNAKASGWICKEAKLAILNEFPTWFAPFKSEGCELVCIHVGSDNGAAQFMQDLAVQNGGKYIHR